MGYSDDAQDPLVARAQRRVGTTLREKWHLDRLLGLGGMAAVYAATHRNGKQAAVKMLHAELSIDAGIRSRFLREGYVANRVGHAGAVSMLDDDTAEDGSAFLVMDLLDGETVDSRWRRKGGLIDPVEVLSISDQLLDVLAAAHERGIIHRDIKPENLFLTRNGEVKVLDFGIARLRDGQAGITATRTGTTMGTPAFMGPEQARGVASEIDARTDIWSVGATMYTLISGRYVHEGRTTNEQLVFAITQHAPPLASVAPNVPTPIASVVDRALAFERCDRWQDARAMQDAIRLAYEAISSGAPLSTAPRLAVPSAAEIAAAATQVSPSGGGAAGGTAVPVSSGQTGVGRLRTLAAGRPAVAGAIGAVALVVVVGTVLALRGRGAPPLDAAGANTGPTAPASAMPSASTVASAAPVASAAVVQPIDIGELPAIDSKEKKKGAGRASGAPPANKTGLAAPAPASTGNPMERRR